MPASASADLFVVSAPSGAGKTTLIRGLMRRLEALGALAFSVSHTTRAPRRGELDGREYHFVDRARFEAMVERDGFLEWAEVHGNLYGTARDEVYPRLAAGVDVVLDIDVQGAEQVFARYPPAIGIFILAPSRELLRERLHGRGSEDPASFERRLGAACAEMSRYSLYPFVIINDDSERASDALAAIVLASRHRRTRMEGSVQAVLATFPPATP